MPLMLGEYILHYRIEQELGSGAMGIVYKALDTKLERYVALKFLHPEHLKQPQLLTRFQIEAKAISKLDHPNIGAVYTLEETQKASFLVMAYYQGQTLAECLHELYDLKTIVTFALEIARGLEHAHRAGVIHRDIKPANIFITSSQQVKILDFGLSRLISGNSANVTEFGKFLGTPLYASPDHIKKPSHANPLFDIWSFGCVLYEMLAKMSPFFGDSLTTTVMNVLSKDPIPLPEIRTDLPEPLLELVHVCLQKNPEMRVQTAQEIVSILEQLLSTWDLGQLDTKSFFLLEPTDSTALGMETPMFAKPTLPPGNNVFIGRESELAHLKKLLGASGERLVSLVGLGGMGKTRLALEVAWQLQDQFRDGVAFVDLSKVKDAALVPYSILQQLKQKPSLNPIQDLLEILAYREMLLILDNFEHVLSQTELLVNILSVAAKLRILVTSRERLHLQAEAVLPLHGFTVTETQIFYFQDVGQLFLNAAKRVQHNFELHEQDKQAFLRIVQILGGSPLGLELAAGWVSVLSLDEIVQELEGGLDLLKTTAPDVPTRHQSLEAVLSSSWQLLTQEEQTSLSQLSVLSGFDKEMALTVCQASLAVLQKLVNKSFLIRHEKRFVIHELVRQYSAKHLSDCNLTLKRLGDVMQNLAREWELHGRGERRAELLQRLETETTNLRTVLGWSLEANLEVGAEITGCLENFWYSLGLYNEGILWTERFLAAYTLPNQIRLKLLFTHLKLSKEASNYAASYSSTQAARALAQVLGDKYSTALTEQLFGALEREKGNLGLARQHLKSAQGMFENINHIYGISRCLNELGMIHVMQDELELSIGCFEQSLQLTQQIGNNHDLAYVLNNLSLVYGMQKKYTLSANLGQEALKLKRVLGDRQSIANSLNNLGEFAIEQGRLSDALILLTEALQILFQIGRRHTQAEVLYQFANAAWQHGDVQMALELKAYAIHLRTVIGSQPNRTWRSELEQWYLQKGISPSETTKVEIRVQTFKHEQVQRIKLTLI
jgi:serine/threonine protein kinase/tetratricopeptide (TPR) repeat protein